MRQRSQGSAPRIPAAVVGAGWMGRWHAEALTKGGGRLTAVIDPDARAARGLAQRYPGTGVHERLERAAERMAEAGGSLAGAVVHVCSPLPSHVAIAEAALTAGAHVLVEKPLAPDLETSERLFEVAKRQGVMLCPCHQYVFQRGLATARAALESIGPLVHAESIACSAGGGTASGRELDRVAGEILPHPLSVFQSLLPEGIGTRRWRVASPTAGELRAQAVVGGSTLSMIVSMAGRPPRNELRLVGRRGTARLDFFHGFGYVQRMRPSRAQKLVEPFHASALTAAAATGNLVRRTLARSPPIPGSLTWCAACT